MYTPHFKQLVQSLRILPSVGPKSAQRMALHLLLRQPKQAQLLANALHEALAHVTLCPQCHNMAEDQALCSVCTDERRDHAQLCVVESPTDVMAIEQSGSFHGVYFVLGGRLSPLDGIGPKELGLDRLFMRLKQEPIQELILATNATVEGEATAHYIHQEALLLGVEKVTRLAKGMPQGGELEYIDTSTLSMALRSRTQF